MVHTSTENKMEKETHSHHIKKQEVISNKVPSKNKVTLKDKAISKNKTLPSKIKQKIHIISHRYSPQDIKISKLQIKH